MTTARALPLFLIAVVTSATAAPDEPVDPAKLKDKVTIAPGKTLAVQFEQNGDALSSPRVVEKAEGKTPTVNFRFLNQGDTLILATRNPFPKDLKFRALYRLKGHKDYVETSIVPVKSGLLGFELWQDAIEELVLFEFKLVGDQP